MNDVQDLRTRVRSPAPRAQRSAGEHVPEPEPGRRQAPRTDLLAAAGYLLGGLWLTAGLWPHPGRRVLVDAPSGGYHGDHLLFEFWLAHGAQVVAHGWNPFYDNHINVPDGINLMANTSVLGLAVPMAPVTLLLGPSVALAVLLILAPAATAFAWYRLFSRYVVASRVAAAVGGAVCGFGPGMVAQTVHPNIVAQFAIPLMVSRLIALTRDDRYRRHGVALGALVVYQAFVNEEILFIAALGLLVFGTVWAASRPALVRARLPYLLGGLGIATAVAAALLAVPLWYQFAGPQHYSGLGVIPVPYNTDVYSFVGYPTQSLGGNPASAALAVNPTEESTFFGWGLVVESLVVAVALWRHIAARGAVVTAAALGALSLGTRLRSDGMYVAAWAPWRLLVHLPLADSVICTRIALGALPPLALLTALALDRAGGNRLLVYAGVAAALLPLFPVPLPTVDRPIAPPFVSAGMWRAHVPPGRSLVVVPLTHSVLTMSWTARQRLGFTMAGGYFLGPDPASPRHVARFGPQPRPTELVWEEAAAGRVPVVGPADRLRARDDLRYWRAGAVIVTRQPYDRQLRAVTTDLLGYPPHWTGGVWVWDVR